MLIILRDKKTSHFAPAMACSECTTWRRSSEGDLHSGAFKAAFNCLCIELYSWACIHQKLKSNVTFSSLTNSPSFRCHSTQKSGNQENAEWFFIMCWKMSAGLKCQSKRENKKEEKEGTRKRRQITYQVAVNEYQMKCNGHLRDNIGKMNN